MDELVFSGKKYISSKRAAQITGYAKDYIGQLARAEKVPGTRVGRAWYVEEDALLAHLNSENIVIEAQNDAEPAKTTDLSDAFRPALAEKTIPTYALYQPKSITKTWGSVKYLVDDDDLIPMLTKRPAETADEISTKNIVISPVQTAQNNFRRPHAETQRAQMLMDGILPPQPVLRVARPARHASEIKKPATQRGNHYIAAFTAVTAVVAISVALSGLFVSSSIEYTASNSEYSAGVLAGFEHAIVAFSDSDLYQGGIESLKEFINDISGSFFTYLQSGIQFLRSL